jgi:hypothetical protein
LKSNWGHVHPAYNPSFSACFFSRNSIFLSQQISQPCFSAGLSAQPNGPLLNPNYRDPAMQGQRQWIKSEQSSIF